MSPSASAVWFIPSGDRGDATRRGGPRALSWTRTPQRGRLPCAVDAQRRNCVVFCDRTAMSTHQLHALHERSFEANRFVYPVISRRSRGLSIGVNLNPDKVCNFDCIYCQVDRTRQSETQFVEIDALLAELSEMLDLATSGEIFRHGEVPRHAARAAAAQRHRLLRRRRADDLPQFRRDHRGVRRAEAGPWPRGREDGAHHQRQHVPPAARARGAWRSSMPTTAKSGRSSKPGRRSITSSSTARRSRFNRFSTTSPRRRECGRW